MPHDRTTLTTQGRNTPLCQADSDATGVIYHCACLLVYRFRQYRYQGQSSRAKYVTYRHLWVMARDKQY